MAAPSGQQRPGPAETTVRCRAGVPGGGPGAARRPVGAQHLAGDRQALGVGRLGRLRVPRVALALALGPEAVPGHGPGRDARDLVPGQSEARRAGKSPRSSVARGPYRGAAAGADPHRRQRLRRTGLPGHRRVKDEPGPPRPQRRGTQIPDSISRIIEEKQVYFEVEEVGEPGPHQREQHPLSGLVPPALTRRRISFPILSRDNSASSTQVPPSGRDSANPRPSAAAASAASGSRKRVTEATTG
jgi:hypothetical protein